MNGKRTIRRAAATLVLATGLGAAYAPAASADPWQLEQATRAAGAPDALDRYVAATAPATPMGLHFEHEDALYGASRPVDYRSADTRDAAAGRYPEAAPTLVSVPGDRVDWSDVGIGAGGTAGALLLAGAAALATRRRRPAHS
jgi:hypothetical protein